MRKSSKGETGAATETTSYYVFPKNCNCIDNDTLVWHKFNLKESLNPNRMGQQIVSCHVNSAQIDKLESFLIPLFLSLNS